jgi:hypothetical protein
LRKQIILFGAGRVGQRALQYYGKENVYCFCDSNKNNQKQYIENKIIDIDELSRIYENYDVVISISNIKCLLEVEGILAEREIPYRHFFDEDLTNKIDNTKIFSDIYAERKWGGIGSLYSGDGSHKDNIIIPYINLLNDFIKNNEIKKICDIGCGDFYIMNQVLKNKDIIYYGLDVVDFLIKYNKETFKNDHWNFLKIDATKKDSQLPFADLLIVRQVLQHLDNESIKELLNKIKNYKYVLITEHVYKGENIVYNVDKPINENIRLYKKSGVYIEKKPFCINNIVNLLEVEEMGGVLRTSLVINI